MQRILFTVLMALIFVKQSNLVQFCDMKSLDNVFNIGHIVYMTRCGEVWAYDPRMDGGAGGFVRDYSIYGYARMKFRNNIITEHQTYDKKYMRFMAFSFQELNCLDREESLTKKCAKAVQLWDTVTVIGDNFTAHTFKYESTLKVKAQTVPNGFGFNEMQDISKDNKQRNRFWPDIKLVGGTNFKEAKELAFIHSGLFDVDTSILYIVLRSEQYYCLTYLNMVDMLYDETQVPNSSTTSYKPDNWAKALCFTGNVIGIFKHKGKVLIAGRVQYDSRKYEDQVYNVLGANKYEMVNVETLTFTLQNIDASGNVVNGAQHPYNLRTLFECPSEAQDTTNTARAKRSAPVETFTQPLRQTIETFVSDIKKEIKNDWIQLSVLSVVALIPLYAIVRLSAIIRSESNKLNKFE